MGAPPTKRGQPFQPRDPQFTDIYCPICAASPKPEQVLMKATAIFKRPPGIGPPAEALDPPTYDYECLRCRFTMNYPCRLKV